MKATYPYSAYLKPLAGLGLTLLGIEGFLRVAPVKKLIPLPSPYYSEIVVDRVETLARFQRKYQNPKIVVIGSSIARANVDSGLLGAKLKTPTFGLGLSALSPGRTELYWNRLWKDKVGQPELILHIMRGKDFTDAYNAFKDEQTLKGRIERQWLTPQGTDPLSRAPFSDLRTTAYYGAVSKSISGQRRPFLGTAFATDEFGTRSEKEAMVGARYEKAQKLYKDSLLGSFEATTQRANTLDIIRRFHQQYGTRYVIVFCPEFINAWSDPGQIWQWQENIQSLMITEGVRFVSPLATETTFCKSNELFFDYVHYNQAGARRFTELLAKQISARNYLNPR
jgi:hypothetical protein